jgi:MFS family permease
MPEAANENSASPIPRKRSHEVPWALVVSSFINKSGEMAISLLPMLLIDRNFSATESSVILGSTKAAQMGGLFVGGFLSDVIGFRFIILTSYFLGFVGFTTLPFLRSNLLITVFSVLAQFGSSLFGPSARSLVRETSGVAVKKSMAWLRTSSNLGQVVSSILGIVLGPFGLLIPFLTDGLTSLAAFFVGIFTLKNPHVGPHPMQKGSVEKGYFLFSVGLAFFYFIYELGFLSFSGFGKLALGNGGIRAFGVMLLINTFLCGILAVPSTNIFHKPRKSLAIGFLLVALGMFLITIFPKTAFYFGVCSLIMSAGEVIFNVHAQTLLLVNSNGKSSRHYGVSLMIQSLGKLAAGVALFPLVLTSNHPSLPFVLAPIGFFIVFIALPKDFIRRGETSD